MTSLKNNEVQLWLGEEFGYVTFDEYDDAVDNTDKYSTRLCRAYEKAVDTKADKAAAMEIERSSAEGAPPSGGSQTKQNSGDISEEEIDAMFADTDTAPTISEVEIDDVLAECLTAEEIEAIFADLSEVEIDEILAKSKKPKTAKLSTAEIKANIANLKKGCFGHNPDEIEEAEAFTETEQETLEKPPLTPAYF